MFPTPDEDTVEASWRALRKVESDKKARQQRRRNLAEGGLLMVGPGRW